jgi:pimeloyl-ACP methyl ester carboxylesterase
MLVEPGETLELWCGHGRAQVIARPGLIRDFDLCAREGRLDHLLDFRQIRHRRDSMGTARRRIGGMGREDARFVSGDEECAAWVFRPAASDGPAPCVVMASGLSCVRDQGLEAFAERFSAAGFVAIAFDYRHFGDSGGEPRSLVQAARQRDDWRAAMAYARSLDAVDADRIALWGFSAGGGHVQSLALSEPGITAAVCVAPLVDGTRTLLYIGGLAHLLRLGMAGARDGLRALRDAEPYRIPVAAPPGSQAVINSPDGLSGFESITGPESSWSNEICARTLLAPPYRLAGKARRIALPILYCITEGDDVAPPALGKLAAERAPRGELRLYPGGHFDAFLGDTFEQVVADQVAFLDRHMPTTGS